MASVKRSGNAWCQGEGKWEVNMLPWVTPDLFDIHVMVLCAGFGACHCEHGMADPSPPYRKAPKG